MSAECRREWRRFFVLLQRASRFDGSVRMCVLRFMFGGIVNWTFFLLCALAVSFCLIGFADRGILYIHRNFYRKCMEKLYYLIKIKNNIYLIRQYICNLYLKSCNFEICFIALGIFHYVRKIFVIIRDIYLLKV